MAKKKATAVVSPDDSSSFTDRALKYVNKEYGDVMTSGDDLVAEPKMVIPWGPAMDIILGGGIEEGSFVGVTGMEKQGKTVFSLSFAANCQKPEYGSRPIYYDRAEGRLSTMHLQAIRGLDLSPGKFSVIRSREGQILTAQKRLNILTNIINTVPGAVIIIDSISAYLDQREFDGGVGTETRGAGAKLFSQWLNMMAEPVSVNRTIVIGITHLMCNTSGMGAQYAEKVTRRWAYQTSYRLRALRKEMWKAGDKTIGIKTNWLCKCSPLGIPEVSTDSYLRFGIGIDSLYEIMEFGTSIGLVEKAGAWYALPFLLNHPELYSEKEPPKAQGAEKIYQLLVEHPEWAAALEKDVKSFMAES